MVASLNTSHLIIFIMKKISYTFLFIVLFLSCEKEVDVFVEPMETLPILNCIFTDDSILDIKLLLSNSLTQISEAEISVFEDDTLCYSDSYSELLADKGRSFEKIANKNYEVCIKITDYKDLKAIGHIPSPVKFRISEFEDSIGYNKYNLLKSSITIEFQDPEYQENYYEISIRRTVDTSSLILIDTTALLFEIDGLTFAEIKKKDLVDEQLTIFSSESSIIEEGFSDQINGSENFYSALSFSDKLFNGLKKELKIEMFPYYSGSYGTTTYFIPSRKFHIELRSISRDYYLFRKTQRAYYHNLSTFDLWKNPSNYVEIYSNVENGLGLFAGYSAFNETFIIENQKPDEINQIY